MRSATPTGIPLCVDLDGTLVRTDTLWESLLGLLRRRPWLVAVVPWQMLRGRARFKAWLAERFMPDPAGLPFDRQVLDFVAAERARGRPVHLVTGAHQRVADAVARHLRLFDSATGSDATRNLTGRSKATWLVERHGERGFDYVGDSRADLEVWARARTGIVAGGSERLVADANRVTRIARVLGRPRRIASDLLRAARPHQWAKNVLVFAPMLLAHVYGSGTAWLLAGAGFLAFCLVASGTYILNDLMDLPADRAHPAKCRRPFASGRLPLIVGMAGGPLLVGAGVLLGAWVSPSFLGVLALYLVCTVAYTLWLKEQPVTDIIALSGLYTARLFAGAEAVHVEVSSWLLLFSVFLFLSLGIAKRYVEVRDAGKAGQRRILHRGYGPQDLRFLEVLGPTCGYLSVLVFALYLSSPKVETLYRRGWILWTMTTLLLYWIGRLWLITLRGQLNHDPVAFALRDRTSYLVAAAGAAIVFLAAPR